MILQILILLLGFLLLVKGADCFVEGAASLAKKLGIPQLIIGLTIVAMGTSMPEAAVSITAALHNNASWLFLVLQRLLQMWQFRNLLYIMRYHL